MKLVYYRSGEEDAGQDEAKRGINVSGERRGTQPPQDEQLGTQPSQDERPVAPRIAEEGESSRDKDGDTGSNER